MELFCPSCQKKLSIADAFAGQVVKCPICSSNFQAPSLPGGATTPIVVAPPAETRDFAELITPEQVYPLPASVPLPERQAETYGMAPLPPPAVHSPPPEPTPPPPKPPRVETPRLEAPATPKPIAKVEYARSATLYFRREVIVWFAPVGMAILFVLSFFAWHSSEQPIQYLNLWELAFSAQGYTSFIFYVVLYWLATIFVVSSFLLELRVIPTHPTVQGFLPWAPLVVAGLMGLAWLIFLLHYLRCNFADYNNPSAIAMKLAFRVHFLVIAGALLDFWLQRRRRAGRPDPRLKARW